jgi:hypothetical protein
MRHILIAWNKDEEHKYRVVIELDDNECKRLMEHKTKFVLEQWVCDVKDGETNAFLKKEVWVEVNDDISEIVGEMPVAVMVETLSLISRFVDDYYDMR